MIVVCSLNGRVHKLSRAFPVVQCFKLRLLAPTILMEIARLQFLFNRSNQYHRNINKNERFEFLGVNLRGSCMTSERFLCICLPLSYWDYPFHHDFFIFAGIMSSSGQIILNISPQVGIPPIFRSSMYISASIFRLSFSFHISSG